MSQIYVFRRGDGFEGNFGTLLIRLEDKDEPSAALCALIANGFPENGYVRRYVTKNTSVSGNREQGFHAVVSAGPDGEKATGDAAWLTAEMLPVENKEGKYVFDLENVFDASASKQYVSLKKSHRRKQNKR